MKQFSAVLTLSALLGILVTLSTAGHAAQRQQGMGINDGECEVVSVGNYYCKVNGKCYYCTKKDNPDPNKDCYKETTCDSAVTRPGIKGGMVRPPTGGLMQEAPASPGVPPSKFQRMPMAPNTGGVRLRGVEGEQPTSSEQDGK